MTIDSFSGEHAFLSNFHFSPVFYGPLRGPTVEHVFQAYKTNDDTRRAMILAADTPGSAKRMGRKAPLRPDWEDVKVLIMQRLVECKFAHEPIGQQLLATGNEFLVEGNTWGDTFWGVCDGQGRNMLGFILMDVREQVRRRTA